MNTAITHSTNKLPLFKKLLGFFLLSLFFSFNISAQEICGNGIDDDGDNLIDCADPECGGETDCADTFACSSDLYQVTSGVLKVLDPASGTYTIIGGSSSYQYNGTGYNVEDGYIYGIYTGNGTELIRINNTGTTEVVGAIANFTGITYSGDFDISGNWLSFKKTGSTWAMGSLDVDASPLSMTSSPMTELAGVGTAGNCADISYNSVTGKYYGCSSGKVIEFDPINKTVKCIANYNSVTGNGGCGAAWSDIDGNTYFFKNSTGNIYRTQFNPDGSIAEFGFIAVSEPNGSNDGMSCPLSSPPVFPEICSNGLDDDGDGLVDCDDPDCTLSTDCGEICDNGIDDDGDGAIDGDDTECNVSGGESGGLESNRRLSNLIAKRNYNNAKSKTATLQPVNYNRNANGIESLIPNNLLEGSTLLDASPIDLINITNAVDVYSTNIMLNNRRMGSVLAIETENVIYEHTKYICDRLDGAIINDLKTISLQEESFIVSQIIHENGNVEYALSFSMRYDDNGNAKIESHWNLDKYTSAEKIYTFQVWANQLDVMQEIVEKIMQNIQNVSGIASVQTSPAPTAFVSTGSYKNGFLELRIVNHAFATDFAFEGSYTSTETGEVKSFNKNSMTWGRSVENIRIEVGSIYDIGFRMTNNADETTDDLFFADGAWGLDYSDAAATISTFEVLPNQGILDVNTQNYLVHRNVQLEATTSESVAVYRSFTPKFRAKNLSQFNQIALNIEGEGTMEITLVKNSLTDWTDQYRSTIDLNADDNQYQIPMAQLLSSGIEGEIELDDVTMFILKFTPPANSSSLNIAITDVQFEYDENAQFTHTEIDNIELVEGESFSFPNPASDVANVLFNADEGVNYTFKLIDNTGRILQTFSAQTTEGTNSIGLTLANLPAGIYYYHVDTKSIKSWEGKILIVK